MASLFERARAYRKSAHFTRLWKFASVSVISTVITQVVLFLTYHEWSIASAMECNVIATAIATGPAYYLNRNWTWGKSGKSHMWREVAPFWVISFIGLVLSTAAVGIAAHNADIISHSKDVRAAVVQLANLGTYGLIWVGRYLIFNKYLFGDGTYVARPVQVSQGVVVDTTAVSKGSASGVEASATSSSSPSAAPLNGTASTTGPVPTVRAADSSQ